MPFQRTCFDLNILESNGGQYSPAIPIPDGASKISIQLFYASLAGDAVLVLEQSSDGSHFDPVLDINGDPVTVTLPSALTSATLNLVNLLCLSIRFNITFASGTEGVITGLNLLTNS